MILESADLLRDQTLCREMGPCIVLLLRQALRLKMQNQGQGSKNITYDCGCAAADS